MEKSKQTKVNIGEGIFKYFHYLTTQYPNDQDLGAVIRKIFREKKNEKT